MLHFLRDQKQSISGFRDDVENPYELFIERLGQEDPQLLEEGMQELERLSKGAKGKWEELKKAQDEEEEAGGFSFGFGGDDDDDDVEVP